MGYLTKENLDQIRKYLGKEGEEATKAWQYNEVIVWGPVTSVE